MLLIVFGKMHSNLLLCIPKGKVELPSLLALNGLVPNTASGISPYNSVSRVTLTVNGSPFGICSLYAPNDYNERIILWDWMTTLPNIMWLVGGDFNTIEYVDDKIGGSPFEWKGSEKTHWDSFKKQFQLFDPLEGLKSEIVALWYTWCNF